MSLRSGVTETRDVDSYASGTPQGHVIQLLRGSYTALFRQLSLLSLRGRSIEYRPVWLGVKAGCVHLCGVAGNTVRSYMASDTP